MKKEKLIEQQYSRDPVMRKTDSLADEVRRLDQMIVRLQRQNRNMMNRINRLESRK